MLQPRIAGEVAAAPDRLSGSWRAGPGSRPPGWHRSCLGMEEYWVALLSPHQPASPGHRWSRPHGRSTGGRRTPWRRRVCTNGLLKQQIITYMNMFRVTMFSISISFYLGFSNNRNSPAHKRCIYFN